MTNNHEDDYIDLTDYVEHKLNPSVRGIVIGVAGSLRQVRLAPSLATAEFHEWELRLIAEDTPPPAAKEDLPTNVINFTAAKELRCDTKTEGAA